MSAKAKISKIASLWYTTSVISSAIAYFAASSQTLMGSLVGLAFSLCLTFFIHRMLLGGSGIVRKIVMLCNLVGMCFLPLGIAASAWTVSAAPLRSIMAIAWMAWSLTLHFRSFTTLKDSAVKRNFA